jgi:alkaline phosphatase
MRAKTLSSQWSLILPLLAILLLCGHDGHAATKSAVHAKKTASHIILFIGDGMQLEHEVAASGYMFGDDFALRFHSFPNKYTIATWDVTTYNHRAALLGKPPYHPQRILPIIGYDPAQGGKLPHPLQTSGINEEYFLNPRYATDSASAATAWVTGYKTDDGNLAWLPGDPPKGKLATVAELLRVRKGFAIGVVSTVPFTHATPAAHVSHNTNRNDYHAIANEILRVTKPEVVIGGGHPLYAGEQYMPMTLYSDIKNQVIRDYTLVERETGSNATSSLRAVAQSAAQQGRKLFGLFGGSGGNFEPPIAQDSPGAPGIDRATFEDPLLPDVTLAALQVLSRDPDGFFLMVEQGDIDWANHENNYRRMVGDVWDLHKAVEAAIEFVDQPGDDIDWSNTLLMVTADHANSFMRLNDAKRLGPGRLPRQVAGTCPDDPAKVCPNYPDGEVSYRVTAHTNELVRLYATGYGAELLDQFAGTWYPDTEIVDNTQIFLAMMQAAGLLQSAPLRLLNTRAPRGGKPSDKPANRPKRTRVPLRAQ